VRSIFIDLDGTLTDPREGIVRCIQHALTRLGRPAPPDGELERFIGPPLSRAFQELLGTDDTVAIDAGLSAYRERFATVGIFENHVHPEIPAALATLRRSGRPIYLLTVKPRPFAERIADHFELSRHLVAICAPELADRAPDKSLLLHHALERHGVDPASAVMVGDRADDVLAARQNRVTAIAVAWGYGSLPELESACPDFIVRSVPELLERLGAA
jgi:phosphoglycolate phosphatase